MKKVQIVLLIAFAAAIASCGNINHTNFNRQKYTDLKTISSDDNSLNEEPENTESTYDKNYQSNESIVKKESTENTSDNFEQEELVNLQSDEMIIVQTNNDEFETNVTIQIKTKFSVSPKKTTFGNPRDFEKLSEKEKIESLIIFNRLFDFGLSIIILGAILIFAAIILGFNGPWWVILSIAGSSLIFMMWILSFFALAEVRRMDASTKNKATRVKFRVAQIFCGMGIAVCIATIFGGVVLLVLWLAGII